MCHWYYPFLIIPLFCIFIKFMLILLGDLDQLNAIYNAAIVAEEQKESDRTIRSQLTATKLSRTSLQPPSITKAPEPPLNTRKVKSPSMREGVNISKRHPPQPAGAGRPKNTSRPKRKCDM
jgi:hypothetical protein